jgi:hypothetical protein
MAKSQHPPLTLEQLAHLIGQAPERLAGHLDPPDGLRVWGDTGVATVHAGGKIQLVVQKRRIHTVVCHDRSD